MAARYFGVELDPGEFSNFEAAATPTAPSLSAWAANSGMWLRTVRLRWRYLMRLR
jgi:ATP-binding cassette subfamily B protein